MAARGTSGVKKLSAEAQALLHRLLDQGEEPEAIARGIREQTGGRVAVASITQYAAAYRRSQEKAKELREGMDGFLERVQREGVQVSDLLRAVLIERLSTVSKDGTAKKLDLLKLEEADRKRGEYELKVRQARSLSEFREWDMHLKYRKQELAEKEFETRIERLQASFQELERKAQTGESLSAEDVRRVREIYGLYEEPDTQTEEYQTAD